MSSADHREPEITARHSRLAITGVGVLGTLGVALVSINLRPGAASVGPVLEEVRDGYAVVTPVDPEHEGWGRIEVRAGATDGLPLAVRGEPWARGAVLSYDLRWIPQDQADAYAEVVSRSRRRERQTARDLVEELATVLVTAVSGVAVDDDGFLVSLGEDAAEA